MSDQSKLAALSDGPAGDIIRSAGAVRSFAAGGPTEAPTEAQKLAGNYRKRHTTVHGLAMSIENEKGSKRSGKGKDGKAWSVAMPAHYGYIRGTTGADGDHVDVYLGPNPGNPLVYVVDQIDHETGEFDEHKVLIGFPTKKAALEAYHRGFSDGHGPDRVGAVRALPVGKFKSWLAKGVRRSPIENVKSFAEGGPVGDDYLSDEEVSKMGLDPDGPGEQDYLSDDEVADMGLDPNGPPEYSALAEAGKRVAKSVLPGLGSLPAMAAGVQAGAAIGSFGGPVGTVAGGIVGGGLAGLAANTSLRHLQDWFLDKLGINVDPEKEAAFQQEHPTLATVADVAGGLAGMSPAKGAGMAARAAGAGIQATFEAGSELYHTGELDPSNIAIAAAAGMAFPGLNKHGQKLWNRGEATAKSYLPGRPDQQPSARAEPLGLPKPADFTVSPEGEAAAYRGGDDQVFDDAAAPRGGTQEENSRPVYELPRDQYGETAPEPTGPATQDNGPGGTTPSAGGRMQGAQTGRIRNTGFSANENVAGQTRPGTAPPDNVALPPERANAAPDKTAESIARSKSDAAPTRNTGGTLGTAHEQPPPQKSPETVGSNPDHPLSVGSKRDYRTTADSNVHPDSSGSESAPTATIGDPARGNISPEIEAALKGQVKDAILQGKTDEHIAGLYDEQGVGFEQARGIRRDAERELTAGEPRERTPIGMEKPVIPDTGIEKAAVTDTVTKLRGHGLDHAAAAVEKNPALGPKARRILQDLTKEQIEGSPVDAEKAQRARRMMERANTPDEKAAAEALMDEARNPTLVDQREAAAAEATTVRAERREAEGQVVKVGDETITASSQRKAGLIKRASDAAQSAFDKFGTGKGEITDEGGYTKLAMRLRAALAHAKEENLGVDPVKRGSAKDTPAQAWLREAQKVVGTPENPKTVLPSAAIKFLGNERMLRSGMKGAAKDVSDLNKVEGDIANNRRRVTSDPNAKALTDWVESLSPEDRAQWEGESIGENGIDADSYQHESTAGKKAGLDYYDQVGDMFRDESGSFNPQAFLRSLQGVFGRNAQLYAKSYIARTPGGVKEEYARSVDDGLNRVNKMDQTNWLDRAKEGRAMPQILRDNAEAVYLAREKDDIASLPADVKAAYQQHLDPIFEHNDHLYDLIEQLAPKTLGPKVISHVYRIAKGLHPDYGGDPVANVTAKHRGLKTNASMMKHREFMAIEDPQGNRTVVSETENGYAEWNGGVSSQRNNANFEAVPGATFADHNGVQMTVKDALTPEIETHAKFGNGQPARYYKNAILSALETNAELRGTLAHLQYLESLKADPRFQELTARVGSDKAKRNEYEESTMPQMKGIAMDKRLRYVFDDFSTPGLTTNRAWNNVRNLSEKVTKMLFVLPTFHLANVGAHWFVDRGWNWIKPGAYRDLAVSSTQAIKSVLAQDTLQDVLREHGFGTQYGSVLNQNRLHNIAVAAGEQIASNPSKWDPIARVMGVTTPDLARAIYRGSSKIMWAGNDMFATQLVLEKMHGGMSMKDAVVDTERHFPNYRVPSTVIGGGEWSRFTSQLLRDNTLFAFGPYHYGVFNSYAHIVKDAVKGDGAERLDAIGKMFAMGVLAFAVYPAFDKMAQLVTGNKDAQLRRRGPLTLPNHITRALQGKEDALNTGPMGTVTVSPLAQGALEQWRNRDFADRPIAEPGDVYQAAHGPRRATAAGRVVVQRAAAAAKNFVPPYQMLSKAIEDKHGFVSGLRDQALDIKNPSPAASVYDKKAAEINLKKAQARQVKGNRGWEEGVYNKLTR